MAAKKSALSRTIAWTKSTPWTPLAAKLAAALAALVVLAWIGRNATAGAAPATVDAGEPPPETATSPPIDGASTAAPTLAPAPSPAPPSAAPAPAATTAPHARATPDEPVWLNLADEAELRRLPGVGAKRAQAILALRQRLGRFTRVEDLLRVKGVGRTTLKKWRPLVRLETARAPPDAGAIN